MLQLVHTPDKWHTCSDSGLKQLTNEQECLDAVKYAKSFNKHAYYRETEFTSYKPKGCIIYDNGEMYFNSHPTGGDTKGSTNGICRKGNGQFRVYTLGEMLYKATLVFSMT